MKTNKQSSIPNEESPRVREFFADPNDGMTPLDTPCSSTGTLEQQQQQQQQQRQEQPQQHQRKQQKQHQEQRHHASSRSDSRSALTESAQQGPRPAKVHRKMSENVAVIMSPHEGLERQGRELLQNSNSNTTSRNASSNANHSKNSASPPRLQKIKESRDDGLQRPQPDYAAESASSLKNSREQELYSAVERVRDAPENAALWVDLAMKIIDKESPENADFDNASSLLQLASRQSRGGQQHCRDPDFWLTLARCHFEVWLSDGILAQPDRLRKAKDACERALEFNEVTSNQKAWEMLVSILLYSGELNVAQKSLEKMVEKFPSHPKMPGILVFHAMCSFGLGVYEDAAEFLKEILCAPPRPYTQYDICLLLGRVYDKASDDEKELDSDIVSMERSVLTKASQALDWFEKAYEIGGVVFERGTESVLGDPSTWKRLAQKCTAAGHFVFAVDCYQEAIEKTENQHRLHSGEEVDPQLWFSLAKSHFRSGNPADAMIAAKHANELNELDSDISWAVDSWTKSESRRRATNKREPLSLDVTLDKVVECTFSRMSLVDRAIIEKKADTNNNDEDNDEEGDKGIVRNNNSDKSVAVEPIEKAEARSEPREEEVPDDVKSLEDELWRSGASKRREKKLASGAGHTTAASEASEASAAWLDRRKPFSPNTTSFALTDDEIQALLPEEIVIDTQALRGGVSISPVRRSYGMYIKTVVSSQLAGKIAKRKIERKMKERKMAEMEATREMREKEEREEEQEAEKRSPKPLWKMKHEEMDRKKATAKQRWKKVKKVISASQAIANANNRKFHPSFDSVRGDVYRKRSVERFKKLGFPSNTARKYQNHWIQKVEYLATTMFEETELRRCMYEVRKHFPNVSNSSAFLALAEARGSVEEACAKLSDDNFLLETKLIAKVVDIRSYVVWDAGGGGGAAAAEDDEDSLVSVDFDKSFDSLSHFSSSTKSLTSLPSIATATTRVPTNWGGRRTKERQRLYMAALANPKLKSNRKSLVDVMVEQYAAERIQSPATSLRLGGVIKSSWLV